MEWKDKKVLINGVTGFIGSNLARELVNRGAEIYSIDNFSYIDSDLAKKKLAGLLKKINLIEGDVSKKDVWEKVPKDIEYIFHFAAPSSITLFKKTPEKCYYETVFGLWNVLEFAKNTPSIKKVIYPSSGSNYAGNKFPLRENIYPKPKNLYAAAKIACEGLASSYSDFVKILGLRIFAGYGPGEEWKKDFGSIIFLFLRDLIDGKKPIIWGDGKQTRDFIYIEDLVKGIIKSAESNLEGVVNLGTGKESSFNEIIEIMKKELGIKQETKHIPKETNYIENLKADTDLMEEFLKIKPILIHEGIKRYIKYLKN